MQYTGNNLLITPHIAWASKQSIVRLIDQIALNIRAFQTGNKRNRV
jgi:glycerate dehydrogenase